MNKNKEWITRYFSIFGICFLLILISVVGGLVKYRVDRDGITEDDRITYEAGKMAGRRDMEDELIKRGLGKRVDDEFVWTDNTRTE